MPLRISSAREGFAMFEAIVALAMFGTSIVLLLQLSRNFFESDTHFERTERRVVLANDLMNKVALWPANELALHFGRREQGAFDLEVSRIAPALFAVTVSDRSGQALLQTVVYRPPKDIAK